MHAAESEAAPAPAADPRGPPPPAAGSATPHPPPGHHPSARLRASFLTGPGPVPEHDASQHASGTDAPPAPAWGRASESAPIEGACRCRALRLADQWQPGSGASESSAADPPPPRPSSASSFHWQVPLRPATAGAGTRREGTRREGGQSAPAAGGARARAGLATPCALTC